MMKHHNSDGEFFIQKVWSSSGHVSPTAHSTLAEAPTLWHMDSYDKPKLCYIGINGCIDGLSHHLMWIEAYTTNTDPNNANYVAL